MKTLPLYNASTASNKYLHKWDWLRILVLWLMVMILRYGFFCLFVLASVETSFSQNKEMTRSAFQAGEILRYKVKWSFLRLGSLVVQQEHADSTHLKRYRIILTAESAQGLPFIDVFFVNRGVVSTETFAGLEFTSDVGRNKESKFVHQIDTSEKTFILTEFKHEQLVHSDTLALNALTYDDPSLFMLFRCLAGSGETREVSSVMESRIETTTFRFPEAQEEIEVGALDHPINAFRFEGKANWTRNDYAGLKGEFCGWVSADSAAIPLRIEAKIFLGSIVLELESYERPGWPVRETLFSHVKK